MRWDSESFYDAFLDFLMKWSAGGYVTDIGQKSLACTEGMMQARKDAHNMRFSETEIFIMGLCSVLFIKSISSFR